MTAIRTTNLYCRCTDAVSLETYHLPPKCWFARNSHVALLGTPTLQDRGPGRISILLELRMLVKPCSWLQQILLEL